MWSYCTIMVEDASASNLLDVPELQSYNISPNAALNHVILEKTPTSMFMYANAVSLDGLLLL